MKLPKEMRQALVFCCFLLFTTCADPVVPRFQLEAGLYVVEGSVADLPGESEVRVSLSMLRDERYRLSAVDGAEVSSVDGDGNEVSWSQVESTSAYRPPANFAGVPGQSYRLRVVTTDGQMLESTPEVMASPVPIVDSRITFSQESYFSTGRDRFIPAFTLFIDLDDPVDQRNYYLINYQKWETIDVCASCPTRQRYRGDGCENWQRNFSERWDYLCETDCWSVRDGEGFELFRDELSNGNRINNVRAGRLDFVSGNAGLLFEARLQAITGAAFRYASTLKEVSEGSGGLNAPSPAALVGNIKSVSNPDDIVLGNFSTASITTHRAYIDRSTVEGTPLPSEYSVMLEPSPMICLPEDVCPPLIPCDAPGRSSEMPAGWGG